ncbi:aminotransferase class III-fold pyridoxal phosphate-dependent enzyme [Geminicoccaceae bacterium 1502E]|nr:aminotransferase class III-fold pyridoxal phosphate-dependent enzyme [Geminicoccaceae bacterium 1502E]
MASSGRNISAAAALEDSTARYIRHNPESLRRFEENRRSMPGGNTRTVIFYDPFPVMLKKGEAQHLWDVDGHRYTDFLGEYSAGLYGHSNPVLKAAAFEAIEGGMVLGGPNGYEGQLASLICQRFPSCERVRFCNSGTEAGLMALGTARSATGRSHIMAFEGAYHGGVLSFGKGNVANVPFPTVLGRYNDIASTLERIEAHANELAAIIVEPMMGSGGAIPGDAEFLQALRDAATRHGIVLIFDEVMTSRLSPGGLQAKLGITPDLTTFGKYLGGGFSFGAFGGRADLMDRLDPSRPNSISHAGTFNNNVASMAAGLAGLRDVFTPEAAVTLNEQGERFRARINETARARGIRMQATGVGSIISLHFNDQPIRSPQDVDPAPELRSLIHLEMMERGFYFARRGYMSLSLCLAPEDFDGFIAAYDDFIQSYESLLT